MTMNKIINTFATQHDCAAFTDSDGVSALQKRTYDDQGVLITQHSPDGCDFHRISAWETAITETPGAAMRWIA